MHALPETFSQWFASKGWSIHPHQQQMLDRADAPSLLLIAPTGGGKTLSGFLPSLIDLADASHEGMHTLYISPLKALANDIRRNLSIPIEEAELPVRVEDRTGDTSYTKRKRQRAEAGARRQEEAQGEEGGGTATEPLPAESGELMRDCVRDEDAHLHAYERLNDPLFDRGRARD